MESERLLAIILFCVLHWIIAFMMLQDLANREKVRGGHKAPWALTIIFITFLGSITYIIFHPTVLYGNDGEK